MKNTYCIAACALIALGASVANADVDIGVALHGEAAPGVYGRIDVAGKSPPPLVYSHPLLISRPPGHVEDPVYLHVPPEHAKSWRLHCQEYHACNRPVYFVKSAEYEHGYHKP